MQSFFTEELKKKVAYYKQKLAEFTRYRPINNDFLFVGLDNKNRGKPLTPKYLNLLFKNTLKNSWKHEK